MTATPSFAVETSYSNAFNPLTASNYDSDKCVVQTSGFENNKETMQNKGYLDYVGNWDYVGYSVNLPEAAEFITITYNSF